MRTIRKKQASRKEIHVHGSLTVAIFKEGNTYIGYAPALDLVAQGKTEKEVQKNFEEVFDIYLTETIQKGTLEKDLRKCGWKMQEGVLQPPMLSSFPSQESIGEDIRLTALAIVPLNDKRLCLG